MTIHTLDELESALTLDLKWRVQELFAFEQLTSNARDSHRDALLRGSLALLYAHWEGFVKAAGSSYLEFISRKRLKLGELRPEIAAIALRGEINKLALERSSESHGRLVVMLWDELGSDAKLPYDKATIRTRANLKFSVFESIMYSLGCDSSRHKTHELLIDERLLGFRNEIAHGRQEYIELDDWLTTRDAVESILKDVRTQIANAAVLETFRRSTP